MKIRMKIDVAGSFHNNPLGVKRGDVVDLDEENALRYIALGYAEPVSKSGERKAEKLERENAAEQDPTIDPHEQVGEPVEPDEAVKAYKFNDEAGEPIPNLGEVAVDDREDDVHLHGAPVALDDEAVDPEVVEAEQVIQDENEAKLAPVEPDLSDLDPETAEAEAELVAENETKLGPPEVKSTRSKRGRK